jgi:dUTP pyrophosphatase
VEPSASWRQKYSIKWKRLNAAAVVPERKTELSAGYDLAPLVDAIIEPFKCVKLPTGLAVELPSGTEGHVRPRSSAFGRGIDLNGTIDADYRGELIMLVWNRTAEPILLKAGERIAQMVVGYVCTWPSGEVEELSSTVRGTGGFGSTGK